ncbi:hypothetical protein D3C78_1765090 [compost metagenome]
MVDVQKHDGQHALSGAALGQLLGKDLIETATVDEIGQCVVVGHLLQGHACLVQLAEQRIHTLQVMLLALQLFVGQCRTDAAGDDQ